MQLRGNGGQLVVPAASVGDGEKFAHNRAAGYDSDLQVNAPHPAEDALRGSETANCGRFRSSNQTTVKHIPASNPSTELVILANCGCFWLSSQTTVKQIPA